MQLLVHIACNTSGPRRAVNTTDLAGVCEVVDIGYGTRLVDREAVGRGLVSMTTALLSPVDSGAVPDCFVSVPRGLTIGVERRR